MRMRGYTLLEVLVATAVFSIVAVAVLSALSSSTRNARLVTDRDREVLLARQKMDELLLDPALPKGVPLEGGWNPALTGSVPCGWRAEVNTFETGVKTAGAAALEKVELEVGCGAQESRRSFHVTGYRRGSLSEAEAAILAERR